MLTIKTQLILLLILGPGSVLVAQNSFGDNHFVINRLPLSPAYAGSGMGYESFLSYNKKLLGIQEAPETKYLSFSAPLPKNIGTAVVVEQYSEGIFASTAVTADIAYHLQLASEHRFSFGLGAGYFNNKLDFSGLSDESLADPLINGESAITANSFNASAGLLYSYKTIQAGIAVPNILKNEMENAAGAVLYSQVGSYRLFASNIFTLASLWKLDTHVLGELEDGGNLGWKVLGTLKYQSKYWLNAGARTGVSYMAGLGALLHSNVVMQYIYEYSGSAVASSGAHQLAIGFFIGKSKSGQNLYSVFDTGQKQPYTDWVD